MSYGTQILACGSAFPERIMTNKEFEAFIDTSDEWIRSRTGIETRRIADRAKNETTVTLATNAARSALARAKVKAEDIELIVVATTTPDRILPCTANEVQGALGNKKAFTFDLQAACSGWVYALSIADQYIKSGMVKNALIIGAETLSTFTNWRDRGTCVLFGDGAGASVLTRTEGEHRVLGTKLQSDGSLCELLTISHGFSKVPAFSSEFRQDKNKIQMQGKEIFKHAVRNMVEISKELLEEHKVPLSGVDFFIFHQANMRIIEMCMKTLGVGEDKTWLNVAKYGNTSSATLPVCIQEATDAGKIGPGSLILCATFGGGLTWGSALFRL